MEFTGERFVPDFCKGEIVDEHMLRYVFAKQFVDGIVVLDAACGEGYGSNILSEKAKYVYGIDISHTAVENAKQKYNKENLEYKENSIAEISVESNSIDMVVSFETIEHVESEIQEKFLSEVKRLLKPNGKLLISTPNKAIYSDLFHYSNEFHVKEFYYEEFVTFLKKYFKNVVVLHQSNAVMSVIYPVKDGSLDFWNNEDLDEVKYLIAICSDEEITNDYSGVAKFYSETKFSQLNKRILELQDAEEVRNKHIKKLDQIIEENNRHTAKLDQIIEEKNRQLQIIHNSVGWKICNRCVLIRDRVLPTGSKRRFVAKLAKKFVKNPGFYFRQLNMENIRKLKYYASSEGMGDLENRLDYFDQKYTQKGNSAKLLFDIPKERDEKEYEILEFPKFEKPLVSIVIPVYNQFAYTYACLKSIIENTQGISYEVIIADDNSTDSTKNINSIVKNLVVVRNPENLRFLLNCNNAAKYAKGDYIHFLNNDTQVQPNWLNSLIALMDNDKTIGMVGSKLIYPDGRLQEAGGILWKDGSAWNYGNKSDPDLPEFNYVKEVDYISGASILIRNELWKRLGGFDTRYVPAYCEDSDLAFEVRKAGFKVVYQPKSLVVHFEGVSNGTDTNVGLKAYQVANSKKFFEKWKDTLKKEHFNNAEDVFVARDRSRNKRGILVIDHYVPERDKDAGSKTVFQYLKLLSENGYSVKFLGDNFFPSQPYTDELEQMGIEVLYGDYYSKNWKRWIQTNCDHIKICLLNRPHIAIKYIDFIKDNTEIKVVYFGVDLHFLREHREYEISHNEDLKKSSDKWKEIEFSIMHKSDVVFYPSIVEVEAIKKLEPSIQVKTYPIFMFPFLPDNMYNPSERNDMMFVGGFTHKPNGDAVIWFHDKIWPIIKEKLPEVKTYILGSNPPDSIKNLSDERFIIKGFVSDDELDAFYKKCKIDIVPLRYGAGVKGKVVEAMWKQIPIVTTDIGAEGIPEAEKALCITNSEVEFAERVIALYTDNTKLMEYSRNGKNCVDVYFTEQSVLELINEDF